MGNYLAEITEYLWRQSWQLAVLIVVVAAVCRILRNRSAHVRYLLWLIVLAKCLVPPFLTVPLAILPAEQRTEPLARLPVAQPLAVREVPEQVSHRSIAMPSISVERDTSKPRTNKFSMPSSYQVVGIVWIVGVVVFGCVAMAKLVRSTLRLRRQRRPLPDGLQTSVGEVFCGFGMESHPKVWLLDGLGQPFVWGLIRGDIYLPADYLRIDNATHRRNILGHEVCHILRLDATVNSLQVLAQAVFWFHPLVWWAHQKTRMEREKCCDEMAVAHLGTRAKEYSAAIVKVLITEHESARPVPSLAVAGPAKDIEERIRTMLRPGRRFHKSPSLIAAMTALLIAVLTVPTALVLTARAAARTAPTPLHQAAADGNLKEARSLISRGARVNAKDNEARTPLFCAAEYGHTLLCDLLIVKGADVNVKDEAGDTPLHHAARLVRHDDFRLAAELARRGADVNATNNQRQTPMHIALEGGTSSQMHIAYMLLRHDVNVNIRDANGKTALHLAAQRAAEYPPRWGNVLSSICAMGAEVNLTNAKGQAALHIACDYEGQDAIRIILRRASSVNVNVVDGDNVTPLHIAARRGQTDACETL
ncbi:MAG: ankyrin repeat domain-containing protein, partial [Phycisphaerales bacterium]